MESTNATLKADLDRRSFLVRTLGIAGASAAGSLALPAAEPAANPAEHDSYDTPKPSAARKATPMINGRDDLRITKVETRLIKPRWLFLKIHTNAGIVGLGEPILEGRAKTCAAAVEELAPYLIGKDQKEAAGGLEFELGTIRTWLKRKVALKVVQHLLASLVYAVAGLGISFFTFFFTYAVVWFGFNFGVTAFSQLVFNKKLRLSHHQILGVCGIFMALLLIENARKSPDDSDSWTSARPMTTQPLWLAGMFGALVSLLINFNTSGKAITDILFIGPRMLTGSINHALAVRRIRHTDFHGCSFALGLLAKSGHKLSAADFAVAIPGSSPADLFSQLIDVQAAILISKEPAVITLTDSVREELRHLLGDPTEFNFKDAAEPIPPTIFGNPDHYALLGLVPPASLDQIKTAYRTVIKEYHPDKFAGGPPGFRALAEEKTKEINAAYEALVASHSAQRGGPGA